MAKPAWKGNRLALKRWLAVVTKSHPRHGTADRWRWSLYYCPKGVPPEGGTPHSLGRATKRRLAREVVEGVLTKLQPGWRRSG